MSVYSVFHSTAPVITQCQLGTKHLSLPVIATPQQILYIKTLNIHTDVYTDGIPWWRSEHALPRSQGPCVETTCNALSIHQEGQGFWTLSCTTTLTFIPHSLHHFSTADFILGLRSKTQSQRPSTFNTISVFAYVVCISGTFLNAPHVLTNWWKCFLHIQSLGLSLPL